MIFKWLTVPWTNRTKAIEVPELWYVRWHSRHGEFFGDTRPEVEAFISEALAEEFATSLENAFRLIKHTGQGTKIQVGK